MLQVLEAELEGEDDYEGSSDDCSGSGEGDSEDSDSEVEGALPVLQDSEDSEGDWEGCDDFEDSCGSEEGSSSSSESSHSSRRGSASPPARKRQRREVDISATNVCAEKVAQELQRVEGLLDAGLRGALQAAKNRRDTDKATSAGRKENAHQEKEEETSKAPANFSRVDSSLPAAELEARFPLFKQALDRGAAVEVTLRAGQMLYIPAGWFHEVRSRATQEQEEKEWGGHLALNYWFHPPDGPSFEQPYASDFWKRDFEARSAI